MLQTLPEKYYLAHAHELFGFVQRECAHLLEDQHKQYLNTFSTLSEDAQCLLVRCLARKPQFIKVATFNYVEIDDIPMAISELCVHNFLNDVGTERSSTLLTVLTKPELLNVLSASHILVSKATRKLELLELAEKHVPPENPVLQTLAKQFIVRRQSRTIDYILFLFFGDLNHRFQKFAMRDLGVLKTRKTAAKLVARFESKAEALSAFELQVYRRSFIQAPTKARAKTADYLLTNTAIGASANVLRDKLLLEVGNSYSNTNSIRAIQLWRSSNNEQAIEKWVRASYKQDKDKLKAELDTMRRTELPAATQVFVEDFYARKYQGKRTSIYTDILRESSHTLTLDEAYINDVEQGVIEHYQQRSVEAQFTENKLWRVLFAFAFWELLFGKEHRQHCEFDRLPARLKDNTFYQKFADQINARLSIFNSPSEALNDFTKIATRHYGKPTGIFRWDAHLLDNLRPCIEFSPPGAIANILRRMAQDYRHTKDGYPDLMVIENRELRFEEIKAPGDTLRPNQLVSINRLRRAGYDVNVIQTSWATNPKQRYAVVDIETTGSRKGHNAITEIAVVTVQNQEIISEWSTLINPQCHIPAHITRLTGIDNQLVSDAPVFSDIAEDLSRQLQGCIFVAHNVGFDYGFIKAAYESMGLSFRHPKYCTVKNARKTFTGLPSYSLGNLAKHFDITLKGAHRALNDARATAQLLRLLQIENGR